MENGKNFFYLALVALHFLVTAIEADLFMMKSNDQSRPFRRRRIHARIADLSAWGAHRRAIGR